MTLNIVLGPPAAGKSTFVRANALLGDLVVDYDAIAMALGSPTSHGAPPDIKWAAQRARRSAIWVAMQPDLEADAWVIHSWPSQEQIEQYTEAGAEFHTVDPGIETVLAQAEADGRPEGTEELIRRWYETREETKSMKTSKTDRSRGVLYKTAAVQVSKADGDAPHGGFEALVSVFGNVDSQWDKILPGAFADSLKSKEVWPVVWSHQIWEDSAIIGKATAKETADGLVFAAEFLDTPRAQNIRSLMDAGLIVEFSWSGQIVEGAWVEPEDGEEYYEIRKADLWEAGPCFKGANNATQLLGVKAQSPLSNGVGDLSQPLDQTVLEAFKATLAAVITAAQTPGQGPGKDQQDSAPAEPFEIPENLKARLALS